MKILLVNTVIGYGSTGSLCLQLAKGIIAHGHSAFLAYSHGSSNFPGGVKFGNTIEQKIHALLSRISGLQSYFSPKGTRDIITWIKRERPDIVHLHNLHTNNINLIRLLDFLGDNNLPTVITLHDCWFFTGKCTHYTEDNCFQWETHCTKCPRLKKDNPSFFFDRTHKMFDDKKLAFGKLKNLGVIGVSDWITSEAERSYLKGAKIIQRIYNWIDQSTFKPINNQGLRSKYGIPKGKPLVLCVSSRWNHTTKYKELIELANILKYNATVAAIGDFKSFRKFPENLIQIPYISSGRQMAELYSLADVYAHLSTEDTFGKVIAESLSCGTPVAVYNSTACPEIVGKGCGLIVEKHNVMKMAEAILQIVSTGKSNYSANCIKHVKENFSYTQLINDTVHFYDRLLNR